MTENIRKDKKAKHTLFIDDMKTRALSLDALRGYAIITMILSGQILLTHLPAWMAHAQVPPGKGFDPSIYGITWVDLVFPFFLFAMGAAFPFSIGSRINKGEKRLSLCWSCFVRGALLVYFAIFFQHMRPHIISGNPPSAAACLLSIASFALMFLMFMNINIPKLKGTKYESLGIWSIKIAALAVGYILMTQLEFSGKKSLVFDPAFSDIILVVLANMAFFGGVIYIFTWKKPLYRLAILPFVMAIFLSGANDGWVRELYNFTPLPWAYKFYYLKYLFIVIPGSIAGEYLHEWINDKAEINKTKENNRQALLVIFLLLSVIACNVIFLYTRDLALNLLITAILLILSYAALRLQKNKFSSFWMRLFIAGSYCLILGLFLEAYEGGIRKDSSTYSYYFVTSGLAFFALAIFSAICDYFRCIKSTNFLVKTGQNPMIAYVATSMLIMPILTITHITDFFDIFNQGPWMGFLRGALLTSLAVLVAMLFTKLKIFWRT